MPRVCIFRLTAASRGEAVRLGWAAWGCVAPWQGGCRSSLQAAKPGAEPGGCCLAKNRLAVAFLRARQCPVEIYQGEALGLRVGCV